MERDRPAEYLRSSPRAMDPGRMLRRRWRRVAAAIACLLVAGAAALLYPRLLGALVAGAGAGEPGSVVPAIVAAWASVALAQALSGALGARLTAQVSESLVHELRRRVFGAYLAAPPERWLGQVQGDRLARLSNDTSAVGAFFGGTVPGIVPSLVTSVGASAILVGTDPTLGIALLLAVAALSLGLGTLGRRTRHVVRDALDAQGEMMGFAEGRLATLPVVKAFGAEAPCAAGFDAASERLRARTVRYLRRQSLIPPLSQAGGSLLLLGLVAVLLIRPDGAAAGGADGGRVVALLFYGLLVVRPLGTLSGAYAKLQHTRAALARIDEVCALGSERGGADGAELALGPTDRPEAASTDPDIGGRPFGGPVRTPLPSARVRVARSCTLEARGLAYAYPDRDGPLRRVDLRLGRGETLLVHGPNGSGKSTLAWLLLRLLEPDAGELSLDGRSSRSLAIRDWRRAFGYVPQHASLHGGSVRDNVALGRDLDDGAIRRALEASGACETVASLPNGLDTVLGDRGGGLSGGQQQRIALARAIAARPAFLILDEATSMLDPASVRDFVATGRRWGEGCGVLIVSHDTTLHALADTVRELRDGELRA